MSGPDENPPASGETAASPRLAVLHAEVDHAAAATAAHHGARLQCKAGCAGCCVDDLTVFEVEANRIRAAHPRLLAEGTPRAAGACAFLDDADRCRIYADRPYVCRTQGLPLRWEDETEDGSWAEFRDICALNEPGEPALVAIPEAACWTLGPYEGRLAQLQAETGAGMTRVSLRSLFARATGAQD